MPNLAKIGVLGHQFEVADGGDVDPDTGRLLSIAELQEALRLVRCGQLGADSTAPAVPPASRATDSVRVERDDTQQSRDDDPYGWDQDGQSPDADNPVEVPTSARRRRVRRGRNHLHPETGGRPRRRGPRRAARPGPEAQGSTAPRPRAAALRAARKILGLDRRPGPQADPPGADIPKLGTDLTDPGLAASLSAPGVAASRRRKAARGTDDDFQVAAAPRGFAAVCWRWTARVLLVVLLFAGVNQLFIRPFHHDTAVPAGAAVIDPAVARQIAARYAADYLSYSPGRAGVNLPALTADSVSTANTPSQLFSGAGYVRTDLVQPGQTVTVDATHVLVAETVRVHLAIPPANAPPRQVAVSAPAAARAGSAGDPGPVPAGWTDLGERWLSITVPVESTPAGLRVSGSGAVFTGEPPTVIAPIGGADPDSATTEATVSVAAAFFTGYAASDVSYLIPSGAAVTGLGGAVRFVSLANWTVRTAAAGAGSASASATTPTAGVGAAAVTWQLAGTAVQITQQYELSLTLTAGRWYTAALGPATTAANQ